MDKIIFVLLIATLALEGQDLKKDCMNCHQAQKIPSELIYRRYLMRYSTNDAMGNAMLRYLKNPKKAYSIMPPQFFLKFPMKEMLSLDDSILKEDIQMYLKAFDIKKKLILKRSSQ